MNLNTQNTQMGLFEPEDIPRLTVDGAANIHPDPATYAAELRGDGYAWLDTLAGIEREDAPSCPACRRHMVLPQWAPVLWTCPDCHPGEVAGPAAAAAAGGVTPR